VAAAAYRSADRLYDERLDRHHDFSNKTGVVHSEVMLPEGAPEEWRDRAKLWNDVEAVEVRKDAQLAREIEFAIPREMSQADGIAWRGTLCRRSSSTGAWWPISMCTGMSDPTASPSPMPM
jgi:hypothetical protein